MFLGFCNTHSHGAIRRRNIEILKMRTKRSCRGGSIALADATSSNGAN